MACDGCGQVILSQLEIVEGLVKKGCKIYGSSKCGWSKKQSEVFSDAKAKKLFLQKVYKNVQDMKNPPKVNGHPTLVFGDQKNPGFKTLQQLEQFVKTGFKFKKSNLNYLEASGTVYGRRRNGNKTCEQKLKTLEYKVKLRGFDYWVYADNVTVIPGKKGVKDKVIFSNIKSCARYQVYNEYNKKLNKDRIITKMSASELNKQLNQLLGPNNIPTCYMEYERCGDNKLRSFAFDLHKSTYCKGKLIFKVNLSHLDGNPEFLTRLRNPEKGHHVACNIDEGHTNTPCKDRKSKRTCVSKYWCGPFKTYCCAGFTTSRPKCTVVAVCSTNSACFN